MAYKTRVIFDTLRSVAFGSIGAAYSAVGTATTVRARLINIKNLTDTDVFISFDGTNNHIVMPAGAGDVYDFTSNKVRDDGFFLPEGTVFYIKRVAGAPTSGSVYIGVVRE